MSNETGVGKRTCKQQEYITKRIIGDRGVTQTRRFQGSKTWKVLQR